MRRTSGSRAAAIRRAQQAKQRRDAQRLQRERQIEAVLADFFEQTQRADDIIAQGRARAGRIMAEAEKAAQEPAALAAQAVAQLAELVETRTALCELTGLSPAEVRELMARSSSAASGAATAEPEVGR